MSTDLAFNQNLFCSPIGLSCARLRGELTCDWHERWQTLDQELATAHRTCTLRCPHSTQPNLTRPTPR